MRGLWLSWHVTLVSPDYILIFINYPTGLGLAAFLASSCGQMFLSYVSSAETQQEQSLKYESLKVLILTYVIA